ncbi:hypothetical protein FH972_025656 [Carpinus fangiana]|uniref:Uncharacterized protein n=1 Tax=Carpinus fangiana TaxID=176857 RepID=A0A5N6L1M7_9ROSI|nr:hypothetical protein FH972_025656 [Carpinus fangiana]
MVNKINTRLAESIGQDEVQLQTCFDQQQENAKRAASQAFNIMSNHAKVQNPKTTRRRKGKSEGYHLAQRREREQAKLKGEAKELSRDVWWPRLRNQISAPILNNSGRSSTPVEYAVDQVSPHNHLPTEFDSASQQGERNAPLIRRAKSELLPQVSDNQEFPKAGETCETTMHCNVPLAVISASSEGTGDNVVPVVMSTMTLPDRTVCASNALALSPAIGDYCPATKTSQHCRRPQDDHNIQILPKPQRSIGFDFGEKARSISKTFRKKFGRWSNRYEPELGRPPNQYVAANRNHFRSINPHIHEKVYGFDRSNWGGFDHDLSREPPPPPTHTDMTLFTQTTSCTDGFPNGTQNGSRVSSWAESEDQAPFQAPDHELKPIQESTEETQPSIGSHWDTRSIQKVHQARVREMRSEVKLSKTPHSNVVDSHRIYSALIKRMSTRGQSRTQLDRSVGVLTLQPRISSSDDPTIEESHNMSEHHSYGRTADQTTIRVIDTDSADGLKDELIEGTRDSGEASYFDDRNLTSPSVYSERAILTRSPSPDRTYMPLSRQHSNGGVADVHESQPAIRYNLPRDGQFESVPNTSAEWRQWASSQVNGLNTDPLLKAQMEFAGAKPVIWQHRRERAQFDGIDIHARGSPVCTRVNDCHPLRSNLDNSVTPMARVVSADICSLPASDTSNTHADTRKSYLRNQDTSNHLTATVIGPHNADVQDLPLHHGHGKLHTHGTRPLVSWKSKKKSYDSIYKQRINANPGGLESDKILQGMKRNVDFQTTPEPRYSQIDSSLLSQIRAGPYENIPPPPFHARRTSDHRPLTGVANDKALSNLRKMDVSGLLKDRNPRNMWSSYDPDSPVRKNKYASSTSSPPGSSPTFL